jgi:hypothetical protein
MKSMLRCRMLAVFFGTLLIPGLCAAGVYEEEVQGGKIDWSNGIVEGVGIGFPPRNAENRAHGRALAAQQAALLARRNILQILRELRIDAEHPGKDTDVMQAFPAGNTSELFSRIENMETYFLPGDKVRCCVAVCIRGALGDILLPSCVREIKHIKGGLPDKKSKSPISAGQKAFTGLVVDCRGLGVRPAMVPRILDEDGNEIYGPATVNRRYAVRNGVAKYVKRMDDALLDHRIGKNPLTVKAVKSSGKNSSDIVISNSDAAKIVGTPANLGFLGEAGVVIVLE